MNQQSRKQTACFALASAFPDISQSCKKRNFAKSRDAYKPWFYARFVNTWLVSDYDQLRSCSLNGVERMRFPVAWKMALATAGGTGGPAGSPSPPHFLPPDNA